MKAPYDKLAKINAKYVGHMTKMAAMPIYGKNNANSFVETRATNQNRKVDDLGTWYVALGMCGLPSLFKWWSSVDLDLLNTKVKFSS